VIESIYIIKKDSGVPLLTLDLVEVEGLDDLDRDIFSGFLKVLDDFSKQTRKESINQIVLANSRIIYEKFDISDNSLLFISIDDLKLKPKQIRKTLAKIATEFEHFYANEIKNFRGNITVFLSFEEQIRKIITSELGTFKEKITLRWNEHPMKNFVTQFTKGKIKEFQESKKAKFARIMGKDMAKIGKFKDSLIRILTDHKAFCIEPKKRFLPKDLPPE